MKEANKELLKRTKFGCLGFMVMLLIIAITGLALEGFSPTISFLVVISLCGFLPVYLNLSRILRSE
ncbi:hypothetical protein ACFL2Y_02270 [Candidatus Omnitrophota bacterium]